MSRVPPAVVAAVLERAASYCEACGWAAAGKMDLQHRRARKRAGRADLDTAENIIVVHHDCHMWMHRHPDEARELGWTISEWDPRADADVPVRVDPRCRSNR